ncbi:MAG: hypothetical protein C4537_08190 [Acholeplasma sp.]|nr:MAG: hypothetical protein C4537_08190 [Acholeplasma sp.]
MLKKVFIHLSGFVIVALGISVILHTNVGATPIDAFNYFIVDIVSIPWFTQGIMTFVTGFTVALISYFAEKGKDVWISIIFLFVVGFFIDLWNILVDLIPTSLYSPLWIRIIIASVTIFVIAFGVSLTLISGLVTSPFERLLKTMHHKGIPLGLAKIMIEGTFLILAIILGLLTGKLLLQVNAFTIILTLSMGPLIAVFMQKITHKKEKGVMIHATE